MGIEATGLGDIFTTPELSSETASRAAGQDFSSFLKALGVFPQPHVGELTAAVGKPTPEAESGDPIPATPALDESDGEPPMFVKIAQQLAVAVSGGEAKPQKRSEEHNSELPSLMRHTYAVLCHKKIHKQT